MAYWLIKTEPGTWSWNDQTKRGVEPWDGVRNYQARNNLKAMTQGDLCFFYHSGNERRIMGIVSVDSPYRIDPTDETGVFGLVDVKTVQSFVQPVTLFSIKMHPHLSHLALIKQSRLSVMPIDDVAWGTILNMSEE